jgi:hypothetical protein
MKTNWKEMLRSLMILGILLTNLGLSSCEEVNEGNDDDQKKEENLPDVSDYKIVTTGQTTAYADMDQINKPSEGQEYYGQNANYKGNAVNYVDNGDGTITDMLTGLMWTKTPDLNGDGVIDVNDKITFGEASSTASALETGDYSDWRVPSIKELYSLIMFYGKDPSGYQGTDTDELTPFINTDYFEMGFGDVSAGERIIDGQFVTSTLDVGDTEFGGGNLMFGVNFVDGRIKGYPTGAMPGQTQGKLFYAYFVRGNSNYGTNSYTNNGDGTITDAATGLMWMQDDAGDGMNWKDALAYAEGKEFAGYSDWRLPSVKELQSIVDYTRAPGATNSAAIDPLFNCTTIINEGGETDYGYYWSGTTHANYMGHGSNACYVSFGRALGYFNGTWMDVHGAGAQRSDPKTGSADDYPTGHGPQGDAIRVLNKVRLVRNI